MAKLTGKRALITGGAGFIGSRLAKRLSGEGASVVVLDNLHPQVHGPGASPPDMGGQVVFIEGDVRDPTSLDNALSQDPDLIFHLAAETGTGQSHDEPTRYCDVNVLGTTRLVEALRKLPARPRRIVLAGSRAVYGEGAYVDNEGRPAIATPRVVSNMASGRFQPTDHAGQPLTAVATEEALPPNPASVYASTKLMQEHVLVQGLAGSTSDVALLRFQNVYGPGQSLKNPYTGVLSIFCDQILAGKRLNIYEDGEIARDFVFVDDVVDSLQRAGDVATPPDGPVNIGSGDATTILAAARILMTRLTGTDVAYDITGDYRLGDVRSAVAHIAKARRDLGWTPRTPLREGLHKLADWAKSAR